MPVRALVTTHFTPPGGGFQCRPISLRPWLPATRRRLWHYIRTLAPYLASADAWPLAQINLTTQASTTPGIIKRRQQSQRQ
jgi:hypothetical protein